MATATASHAMVTSQLECNVCNSVFTMLPCGHMLCLKNTASTSVTQKTDAGTNEIQSPLRDADVSISDRSMQDLPTNLAISDCVLHGDGDEHGTTEHVCVECWCETASLLQLKQLHTSITNRLNGIERRMMQQNCLTEINTQEKAGNSDALLTEDIKRCHPKCKLEQIVLQLNSKILQIDERLSKFEETNNMCTRNENIVPINSTTGIATITVVDKKVEDISDRLLQEINCIKCDNE